MTTPVRIVTPLRRGLINNSTCTTFANPVDTTTEPVTVDSGTPTSNSVVLTPSHRYTIFQLFGTDADNETINARIFGWRKTANKLVSGTASVSWTPEFVLGLTATISSTLAGVAGAVVIATEYWCDTIVADTTLLGTTDRLIISPANNVKATVILPNWGYERLEMRFDIGTAASANVAYAFAE